MRKTGQGNVNAILHKWKCTLLAYSLLLLLFLVVVVVVVEYTLKSRNTIKNILNNKLH
jgi:hypothetical protein